MVELTDGERNPERSVGTPSKTDANATVNIDFYYQRTSLNITSVHEL